MKIGIIGWYGHKNAGDERILYCLKKFFSGHEIITTIDIGDAIKRIDEFNTCDFVLLGGGGLVLRGFNCYSSLFDKLKARFGCVGISVEAVHADNIEFINGIKDKSEFILVRDNNSRKLLNNNPKIIVGPDLTFLYPYEVIQKPEESEICGLNLRYWHYWNSEHNSEFCKFMINLTRKHPIVKKLYPFAKWDPRKVFKFTNKHFKQVIPVPLYYENVNDNDYEITKEYFENISKDFSPSIYQECRYFIGMRLHSLIFAVQMGIPFISLSYQPKNSSFCEDLGYKSLSVDLYNLNKLNKSIKVLKSSYNDIRSDFLEYREKSYKEIHLIMESIYKRMNE